MKRERFLSGSECGYLFYCVFSQTTGRATGERMVAQWLQLFLHLRGRELSLCVQAMEGLLLHLAGT